MLGEWVARGYSQLPCEMLIGSESSGKPAPTNCSRVKYSSKAADLMVAPPNSVLDYVFVSPYGEEIRRKHFSRPTSVTSRTLSKKGPAVRAPAPEEHSVAQTQINWIRAAICVIDEWPAFRRVPVAINPPPQCERRGLFLTGLNRRQMGSANRNGLQDRARPQGPN